MEKTYSVCIVGAGSRYTPGILRMLVSEMERFPLSRIVLYDNEPERLEKVYLFADILLKEYYPQCKVSRTTDPQEAYPDIDFAFVQIRAGRLKMRELDEKIAIRNGRIGQETCGAGGFAYGMRSIPAVIQIIKDIRKYSPNAWILNYSNPAAIVAEATKRVFKGDNRIINICDMPVAIMGLYANVLNIDVNNLEPRYFGLNHYGWFTHVYDKKTGHDYLPELQQLYKKLYAQTNDNHHCDDSWSETFRFMSVMINDYEDYLPNTYLQYYLYPDHMMSMENPDYSRANEVMDGHEKITFEMLDKVIAAGRIRDTEYALKKGVNDGHAKYIVDLATSIADNKNDIFLCMIENHGIISNLSEGMMVEVPCRAGANGIEALSVGEIPTFQKGLLENQFAYEKLTVDACLEGKYKYAWQALTLNRCVNDTQVAKKLLDEYIEANKGYWPELK